MKSLTQGFSIFLILAITGLLNIASAQQINSQTLSGASVNSTETCATLGPAVTVSTQDGRVGVWRANSSFPQLKPSIWIGNPKGNSTSSSNMTAPQKATYTIHFSQPVEQVEITVNGLSNHNQPIEELSSFKTEHGTANISFTPTAGTTTYNTGSKVISSNDRFGEGVIKYQGNAAFTTFSFYHTQHPRNIGFGIANVVMKPAKPCGWADCWAGCKLTEAGIDFIFNHPKSKGHERLFFFSY